MHRLARKRLARLAAADALPAAARGKIDRRPMAAHEVILVALVDILCHAACCCARCDEATTHGWIHVEKEDEIGARQRKLFVFEILKPREKRFALCFILDLHGLMHHVRRRVAVGEDDRTCLKICTPFHLKRSVAVDGKEGGCSVGVDFGRTFAEIAAEVHAHERRRRRSIVGELDLPHAAAFGDEPFLEHLRLRRLARTVARLQDEEFPIRLQTSNLLHTSAISILGAAPALTPHTAHGG